MRVLIGAKNSEVQPGTLLSELAEIYERKMAEDPMIQATKQETGKSLLVFIVNGTVVHPHNLVTTVLKDGDDIRIHHPFFGG